ncbi:MAG: glycoside hydrolase/phage tail family protein [Pseudomonadota bacterium]
MAQLILTAASTAARAVGQSGVGQALASSAASTVANFAASTATSLIFGPRKRRVEGPRLESFQVQASTEGAPILRVFGRARIAGQVIWAARFKETISEEVEGGKANRTSTQTTTVSYIYSISLAIALCEGEIGRVGRVWADGKPLDLTGINIRIYQGTADQKPDPVIEAIEGSEHAPAFRNTAYVVFEDLVLTDFGNRIPQFSFEVERPLYTADTLSLETQMTGVSIIPASGEFAYGTTPVSRVLAPGAYEAENTYNGQGQTDFAVSMDILRETAPNIQYTSLIVSWFGSDLRAGMCQIAPGIERRDKETLPFDWSVSGQTRDEAYLISETDGRANFGGTPDDRTVLEALDRLFDEGWGVMFHPFILMDIPAGNTLPDPDDTGTQAAFPWRGRISAGTRDGSSLAADDVAQFFGAAQVADFAVSGDGIQYTGPAEQSFRRMILHYAHLCALAQTRAGKSLDAFLLGSELRGLTTIRDGDGGYPAVAALRALAADVRAILGPNVALSYGADWTEYSGHQLPDEPPFAAGDKVFHLDPFWADPNVNFVGIDNYLPLSDWRPGSTHLDADQYEAGGPYAGAYLQANIAGGEGYDWFYASETDRDNQQRTPITDGAYGEPWIYRLKDFWSWWREPHHNRVAGTRAPVPTPWMPHSKPLRFTELGCPAVDNGAAQPNVFVDPKSAESALPYFSRGTRDDMAQRRFLEAHLGYWRDAANNPTSPVYGGPMVDPDRHYIYAWDARPFPAFPARTDIWGDTANWTRGHWLNGRLGRAPLDVLVAALAREAGLARVDSAQLEGVLSGYVVDRPMSAREMIDPLADIYQFDMVETGAGLRFQPRFASLVSGTPAVTLSLDDLVPGAGEGGAFSRTERQHIDLPSAFRLGFADEGADYSAAVATARDPGLRSAREDGQSAAIVTTMEDAQARARALLADGWIMAETVQFSVPATTLTLEPGDVVHFADGTQTAPYRILEIDDGLQRDLQLVRFSPSVYESPAGEATFRLPSPRSTASGPLDWFIFETPTLVENEPSGTLRFAASASPWPGAAVLFRTQTGVADSPRQQVALAEAPSVIARLAIPLLPAPPGRWIRQSVEIDLTGTTLAAASELSVFAGANLCMLVLPDGETELLQFREAALIAPGRWRLSTFLRGQLGTETPAMAGAPAGTPLVIVANGSVEGAGDGRAPVQVPVGLDRLGVPAVWQAGPASSPATSPLFTAAEYTPRGVNLRPLAPVHLRSNHRDGANYLRWIRRTRVGGDRWEGAEVPLGETRETYEVQVTAGSEVLRAVTVNSAEWTYDDAARDEDLMARANGDQALQVRVAQLSDAVGLGVWSRPLFLS